MNSTTLPTTDVAQIIQALPPQWHGVASLVMQAGIALVIAGQFVANRGGLKGLWNAVWNGKPGA